MVCQEVFSNHLPLVAILNRVALALVAWFGVASFLAESLFGPLIHLLLALALAPYLLRSLNQLNLINFVTDVLDVELDVLLILIFDVYAVQVLRAHLRLDLGVELLALLVF